jgi:S-formylglutathione hydrolase FrmB
MAGWYSDWVSDADNTIGRQRWETYHLDELRPWVEQTFHTRTDRAGRTIAGLSMGGSGALKYAARRADLFGFAAAFSGGVDILDDRIGKTVDAMAALSGGKKGDTWGPWPASIPVRRQHNPVDLAENLRDTVLELRTGNGRLDADGPVVDTIEAGVHQGMTTLHNRLVELGIEHVWDDYGPGVHDWPYWTRALAQALPALMRSTESR